jgi:transcriptional regulator GlxA family with amidase domain
VLDQHLVLEDTDLDEVVALADHHHPLDGLAAGQELRLADDRGPAAAGLARTRVAAYAQELERTFFEERQIDGAAARLGLSRRRFTTLFREVSGDTWFNTVRALRLAHARRLLRETGRSVTSICYECGFEDISNFYRAFRAAERTSPDSWRRGLVNEKPRQVPR